MRPEIMEGILRHIQPIEGLEQARLLEVSPGHARLSLNIPSTAINLYGNLHGGFLFSLCDMAAGISTYAYEITNVTQSGNIQFLKGISSGEIFIESTAIHKGKRTVVNQVTIAREDGTLLVSATFTMFLLSPI